MSDLTDRITAVVYREFHGRYITEECAAHVAERVAEALHLTEDPILNVSIAHCPWCDENGLIDEGVEGLRRCKNHHKIVWRGWSAVEDTDRT